MAYKAPYIDDTGVHIPSYKDILYYLVGNKDSSVISEKYGLYQQIYGNDVYLEEDSQDYQFMSALALLFYDCCQAFLLAYTNQSPDTAMGTSLDRLCAINGIVRQAVEYSTANLALTGRAYSTISYPQAKDINGYIWQLNESITFDSNGDATAVASCTTPGDIQAAANTINIMATPMKDWYSVNNSVPATPGQAVETDSELRERRYQAVGIKAITPFDAIISYLEQLTADDGSVLAHRVAGYENDTNLAINLGQTTYTQGGQTYTVNIDLPAHSVALIVDSNTDTATLNAIGEAIYLKKTPGTGTFKTPNPNYGFSVAVQSSHSGLSNIINFSIPEPVTTTISITLTELPGYTTEIENQIKQNVADYINGLSIGEDLVNTNLIPVILEADSDSSSQTFYVGTITVNSSTTGVTTTPFQSLICDVTNVTIVPAN